MNAHQQEQALVTARRAWATRMGEAAANFLATLTTDQRRKAVLDFDDEAARTFWHYTPIERVGLPLGEMSRPQQQLAHQLVATGLSRSGYVTASTIIGLENTLDFLEKWSFEGPGRDPGLFYVSFYGEPDAERPWAWQFEGHHISLNYTIVKGQLVAPTPTFFGSNPAEAPLGRVGTLRPLAGEEDLARDLVHTLDKERQAKAVIAGDAPSDIITRNEPYLASNMLPESIAASLGVAAEALRYTEKPAGLAGQSMTQAQREILSTLLKQYLHRLPDEIAELESKRIALQGLESMHFAWAGGLEKGEPHYYRIQGPGLLIEYDNTQNNANHIHSVWRDPVDDFGAALLASHYHRQHRHKRQTKRR